MANDSIRKIFMATAIVGLVVYLMFAFVIKFENDNEFSSKITDNEVINKTYASLGSNLSNLDDSTTAQDINQNDPGAVTESSGELVSLSILDSAKTTKSIIYGIFNVLVVLPASFLGVPAVVIVVITSILGVALIFFFWRLIRAGE